jgi:hypothetical protein
MNERLLFHAITAIFSVISWHKLHTLQGDDDDVRFVLDQHAELDFYSASSLKQQSAGLSTGTHYPDSEPTSFSSYSLKFNTVYIFNINVNKNVVVVAIMGFRPTMKKNIL